MCYGEKPAGLVRSLHKVLHKSLHKLPPKSALPTVSTYYNCESSKRCTGDRCAAYQWPVKTPGNGCTAVLPGGVSLVHCPWHIFALFKTHHIGDLGRGCHLNPSMSWNKYGQARDSRSKVMRKQRYCLARGLYFMLRWKLTCFRTRLRPKKGDNGRKTC